MSPDRFQLSNFGAYVCGASTPLRSVCCEADAAAVGEVTSGPRPFAPADRSRFLQALDAAVVRARRPV